MNRLRQYLIYAFLLLFSIISVAQPYPEWEQYISPNGGIWECKLKDKILYCGTYGAGLIEFNLETKETIPYTVYNSGLASNEINDVDIDNDGNIWLGHWGNGISKIQGKECLIFNAANSGLQNDTVNTVCLDHNNKIWIGTMQGIDVFDGENWTYYNKSNSGLTDNRIFTIEVDEDNNKWIGSVNSFVIFDDLDWETFAFDWQQENSFEEIAVIDRETAYFDISFFGSGLFKFQNDTLVSLSWPGPLYKYITDIELDVNENLWVSVRNANDYGIGMYNGSEFIEYSLGYLGNDCRTINVDQDNNKFIGVDQKGLVKFDNLSFQKINDGLFGCEYAETIAIKNDSSVWFGIYNNLVEFSSGEWKNSNDFTYGFDMAEIRDIDINSNGDIWVAGGSEAILFNDEDWFLYNDINSPLTTIWPDIHDILVDANDVLWIAENGLLRFDGQWSSYNIGNSSIPFDNVLSLAMDSTGVLWLGGLNDLASFDGQAFHHYETVAGNITFERIHSICVDSVNTKWIGSEHGLIVYRNENWEIYDTLNSGLPANYVIAVQIDKAGNLWAGTENGIGVMKNNNWTIYNTDNSSLSSNFIFNIEVSENNTIWITTSIGIAKYNQDGFTQVEIYPTNYGIDLSIECFPNPFSEHINIEFLLHEKTFGKVLIYNNRGQLIRTLRSSSFESGKNKLSWDGRNNLGRKVDKGVYYCKFLSEEFNGYSKIIKQ